MTFAEAVEVFYSKSATGKVPSLLDGTRRKISPNRRNVIVSHVRNGLRSATGKSSVDEVELGPYLEILPEAAQRDAEEHGRSQPRAEASNCRVFLLATEGHRADISRRRPVRRESFLPSWLPLYDSLVSQDGLRAYDRDLAFLQDFITLHVGPTQPRDIPDRRALESWTTVTDRADVRRGITAFRKAVELLDDPSIETIASLSSYGERGLSSLPDLKERLRCAAGPAGPVEDVPLDQQICLLAPRIGQAVNRYRRWARGQKSDVWVNESIVYAFSHLVAELIRMGTDVSEIDLIDLFTRTVEVKTTARAGSLIARHVAGPTDVVEKSLLQIVLDRAARQVAGNSPLELAETQDLPDDVIPFYPPTIERELSAIWSVTREVYGEGLGEGVGMAEAARETWLKVESEVDRIWTRISKLNSQRRIRGQIDKSLICITWAQAVCVGIPRYWKAAHEAREGFYELLGREGDGRANRATEIKRAMSVYEDRLLDYLCFALLLDDGLRVSNYAFGCLGKHFLPTFDRSQGKVVGIASLETNWCGYDSQAPLKKKENILARENRRIRRVLPGLVDMELLSDYVLVVRPARLTALGLLDSAEHYEPSEDRFALFLSPRSTSPSGGYSSPRPLSERFGRLLNNVMREMGFRDVPSMEELNANPSLRAKWRGLWGGHIVRQLIASFFGGILGEWTYAAWLTDDKEDTLKAHYLSFADDMAQRLTADGVRGPDHFDAVVAALRVGKVIDWRTFDPEAPHLP